MDARRFADLLTGYCLEVEPGQDVVIRSTTLAEPLLLELQRAVLEADAWPHLRAELPAAQVAFYRHARDRHLDLHSDLAYEENKKAKALLGIQAPHDTRALAGVDPALIARAAVARKPLRELTMKRRWCTTLWPTPALAAQAGMELADFEAFVTRALFLDQDEPVKAWGGLRAFQDTLIAKLAKVKEIRIRSAGTDLTVNVKGRKWVNSDGKRNMPSGEVFTGPHESSAEGTIHFDVPSGPAGVEVSGVTMELREGVVVDARAEVGDEYLQQALRTDEGARRFGELGIGTNFGIDRPIGAILFDEKIGGTVHLALGRSYPETGGKNESALHWDLICDLRTGGSIEADGEVVSLDGKFVRAPG